jgi:hypothetical protein
MRFVFSSVVTLFCAIAFAQSPTWNKLPGGATDIGVGANGSVWIIGGDAVQGGFSIYHWNGSAWDKIPGGAVRIAVDPKGMPWVINNTNNIFQWNGSAWDQKPGAAIDIGIGADGSVWVLGVNDAPHKWDGTNWRMISGGAKNIAVDPKGNPWVVNGADQIYHWNGSDWELIPGSAKDIAVSNDGTPYIVGGNAGTGGYHVYYRSSGNWQEESGVGVRIAAGPAGVVYVVQDAVNNYAILSRPVAVPPSLQGQTITLQGTTSLQVTQPPPTPPASGSSSVTGGTLVVGAGPTPASNTPLVVETYIGPPPVQEPHGTLICPIIGTGARLVKGCSFVGEPALFLGKAPSTDCPSGSFFDPENGGECWSCPAGYIRNVSPVTSKDACWKAVSEDLKPATKVGSTGCPGGTFVDPRNGGECWSCPSGYIRTLTPVTDSKACAKDLIVGPWSSATFHKKAGTCEGSSFFDLIDGGTCWTCPDGYRRTANPVNGNAACAMTIPTQYASATLISGCGKYSGHFGYGTAFRDPRNGGECWACPIQLKRSASPVNSTATGMFAACVVGGETEGIVWQSPQYPEPGMFRFMDQLVAQAFKDPKRVDAFIQKRANGDPAKRKALWDKMVNTPHDSPEYKALLFAQLVTVANQDGTPPGWLSVEAFQDYIRARKVFIAQDAVDMYEAWRDVNAYNQYQAARRASGIGGMDPSVLGGTPGDYVSLAWIGASPDQRGGEFLEALDDLGSLSGAGALGSNPSSPDDGFNTAYLLPIYKIMEKGLDKYSDWALDTVSWGKISGKAFQTAGKVAGLALIAVQSAVDFSTAITTIVGQQEAEKQYSQLVADAKQQVSVRQMLRSGKDEDMQQLLLFFALASSPYQYGPKAGDGQLNDATLCADPKLGERCKYSAGIVRAAGDAVKVWEAPAPPPPKPTLADTMEEARVVSIDPETTTVRARLVDFGRIVSIRTGNSALLGTVKVGSIVYVDIAKGTASFDGKTVCCTAKFETGGAKINN